MSAPTKALKMMTLVFPASPNTPTQASRAATNPVNGFMSLRSVHPSQIPMNNETKTCRVAMAKAMANTGGSTESQVGSLIMRAPRERVGGG